MDLSVPKLTACVQHVVALRPVTGRVRTDLPVWLAGPESFDLTQTIEWLDLPAEALQHLALQLRMSAYQMDSIHRGVSVAFRRR